MVLTLSQTLILLIPLSDSVKLVRANEKDHESRVPQYPETASGIIGCFLKQRHTLFQSEQGEMGGGVRDRGRWRKREREEEGERGRGREGEKEGERDGGGGKGDVKE